MNNSCEDLVKLVQLSKGQCCQSCHESWEDLMIDPGLNTYEIEYQGKVYYVCCNIYKQYKDKVVND